MNKLVHVVADYAPGDLAFAEIVSALAHHLPNDFKWHLTSIHSFDTVSTGFVVAQLAMQSPGLRPTETIVYANCAPRKDRAEARQNNEGEGFVYGVLSNGAKVLAVNSGFSLSFVRRDLVELRVVNVDRGGSQFRSRDNFPQAVGQIAYGKTDLLGDELDPLQVIQEPPRSVIGYVDSFGNLKTTMRDGDIEVSELEPGQRLTAVINDVEMSVTVAAGSFNVKEGDIALAPGSSGHGQKFWEIFQRGGSAWHTYKKPRPGARIILKK